MVDSSHIRKLFVIIAVLKRNHRYKFVVRVLKRFITPGVTNGEQPKNFIIGSGLTMKYG